MAGRPRDPSGRFVSGSAPGSEDGGNTETSMEIRSGRAGPSRRTSRRNSPSEETLRVRLDWILRDIRPRIEWRQEEEHGINLEDLPHNQQNVWKALKGVQQEGEMSGESEERIQSFQAEIDSLYGDLLMEREKQRDRMQKDLDTQKRLGKMTRQEVERIKLAMDSFVTNELSSHLAIAIGQHFRAYPIANDVGNYFRTNPISSIPPAHEQDAWKAAIENIVLQHRQPVPEIPKIDDIVSQVSRTIMSQLDGWKASLTDIVTRHTSEETIQRRVDRAVSRQAGPSSAGLSEERIQRMINTSRPG